MEGQDEGFGGDGNAVSVVLWMLEDHVRLVKHMLWGFDCGGGGDCSMEGRDVGKAMPVMNDSGDL